MAAESAAMYHHAAVDRVRSSPKRILTVVARPSVPTRAGVAGGLLGGGATPFGQTLGA